MQHTAINAKYQRAVERLYKADRKLCAFINANQVKLEKLDPDSDKYWDTEQRLVDREADMQSELSQRFADELPQRELDAFAKSYEAFHGYGPYLV